jgi:predicted permease
MTVWRWLGTRRHRDREIDEEISAHIDMATRDGVERGMSADEARAAAMRQLGNAALVKQITREVWSRSTVEHFVDDMRMGVRVLWHAPVLSATAIGLVALVIGGNATIYSIVNGMLVSPAAGVTSDRLVAIKHVEAGAPIADPFVSFPNYVDYARLATTLQSLAGWSGERLTLATDTGNYGVFAALVTSNYFDTLGVAMTHGRALGAADDEAAEGIVAVISTRLWRERFAERPDVVGARIRINRVPVVVVGVAATGFAGALLTPGEDVWLPMRAYYRAIGSADVLENRTQPLVAMVGQRIPSASLASVRAEFDTLARQLRAAFPESFTTYTGQGVVPMKNPRVTVSAYSAAALLPMADMAPRFLALFSIVTLLTLLVVSANVANLMLGRAVERQRDTAVRQSLGASRVRIVRMLLGEGAAIAIVAWGASCLVAWWTSRAVLQVIEPQPGLLAQIRPDWTLAAYAMVLAGVATIAFTLAPAIRAWSLPVLPLLRSGESAVASGRSRLSNTLVVLQLGLSVVLLTSAGLAYRSLSMLDSGDLGFNAENLLLVTVRAGQQDAFVTSAPNEVERRAELAMLERVRERLAQENGVGGVTYSRRVPGAFALATTRVRAVGVDAAVPVFVRPVGPDYLRTLGLQPVAGRDVTAADKQGATRTAVINQQLAEELFQGRSAIGQVLLDVDRGGPVEIVGVAPNALVDGPVHDPRPRYVFVPRQQLTGGMFVDMTFFVRHEATLEAMTPRVGRAIAEVDPTLPIVSMSTMKARLSQVTAIEAQVTTLVIAFALVALIVAALGQYAVSMFNMRRRTRDLGVRMALGASSQRIQKTVIREALGLALPGVLLGFALSAAVAVVFRAALFGVTPLDPVTYSGVLLLIAMTTIVASYLPAWRAGRINVIEALRQE